MLSCECLIRGFLVLTHQGAPAVKKPETKEPKWITAMLHTIMYKYYYLNITIIAADIILHAAAIGAFI